MKKISILCVIIMTATLLFAGEPAEVKDLSGWNGTWVNALTLSESPVMMKLYEAVAAETDGYTPQEIQKSFRQMYHTDFANIVIKDNKVVFQNVGNSKADAESTYRLEGQSPYKWGEYTFYWHTFKAVSGTGYDYLVLLQVHADEGSDLYHFHFRYGNDGFEQLLDNSEFAMWWPTMFAEGTTAEDVYDNMISEIDEIVEMLPSRTKQGDDDNPSSSK